MNALIILCFVAININGLYAHSKHSVTPHTLFYTQTQWDVLNDRWGNEKTSEKLLNDLILNESFQKMSTNDTTQWVYFGAENLGYQEISDQKTKNDIQNHNRIKQYTDSIVQRYDISNTNRYILSYNSKLLRQDQHMVLFSASDAYNKDAPNTYSTFNKYKEMDGCSDIVSHTLPDTLTLPKGLSCLWEINPLWNDFNMSLGFIAGEQFERNKAIVSDEKYGTYYQSQYATFPHVGGYTALTDDYFHLDYIIVRVLDGFIFPSLDTERIPQNTQIGDTITVYIKGNHDDMTSWEPAFSLSGVTGTLLDYNKKQARFIITSEGMATVTLVHNGVLVRPDESLSFPIGNISSVNEKQENIHIYTAHQSIYVQSELDQSALSVYDINGREVFRSTFKGNKNFSMQNLKGVYFVRVISHNYNHSQTILLE